MVRRRRWSVGERDGQEGRPRKRGRKRWRTEPTQAPQGPFFRGFPSSLLPHGGVPNPGSGGQTDPREEVKPWTFDVRQSTLLEELHGQAAPMPLFSQPRPQEHPPLADGHPTRPPPPSPYPPGLMGLRLRLAPADSRPGGPAQRADAPSLSLYETSSKTILSSPPSPHHPMLRPPSSLRKDEWPVCAFVPPSLRPPIHPSFPKPVPSIHGLTIALPFRRTLTHRTAWVAPL